MLKTEILKEYGIIFENEELLNTALTHTSYSNEHNTLNYERLEYLGDAILELVFSSYVYNNTNLTPGEMSKLRSLYVCENALFEYAKKFNLSDYILVGNGVKKPNKTVIADVFEAVFAVIYLEKGIDACKSLFNDLIVPFMDKHKDFLKDYKSLLQELVQTERKTIEYRVENEYGPSHNKTFEVCVYIEGMLYGRGVGKSKKEAEQEAAKDAFNHQAK